MSEKKFNTEGKKYKVGDTVRHIPRGIGVVEELEVEDYVGLFDVYVNFGKESFWVHSKDLKHYNIDISENQTPAAQWQKCGVDCDCEEECKQLLADTPQIMQELSNRDKWQKEAEDTPIAKLRFFFSKHLPDILEEEATKLLYDMVGQYDQQHTTHLAQLQGEIDEISDVLNSCAMLLGAPNNEGMGEIVTRLRTITQTKMKAE